jgi:hypothetical protein
MSITSRSYTIGEEVINQWQAKNDLFTLITCRAKKKEPMRVKVEQTTLTQNTGRLVTSLHLAKSSIIALREGLAYNLSLRAKDANQKYLFHYGGCLRRRKSL